MTAEKIIQQINKDTESEIKNIIKEAEKQARIIIENAKKEAKIQAETIFLVGKKQSENNKKILIAKAKQELKHEIMNVKEKIIEETFLQANSQLSKINEQKYIKIVTNLMENSRKKIGVDCKIFSSRDIDRTIAKNLGLKIDGTVDASGGFIALSNDERIKQNNTFEGIINRKKDKLRVIVGKKLFS